MAWTDGVDRATGYLVAAVDYNNLLGATGSLMTLKAHAHGGATGEGATSIGPLVLADFTDAAAPAAPGAGKTRQYSVGGVPHFRAGAAGADTALSTLALTANAPTNSAEGDAAAVGAGTAAAKDDHRHGREAFVAPAIVLGTAAAAGAATTPIRSDATIVAFDATTPVVQAFSDAAATGAAAVAARRDHRHGMPAAGADVANVTGILRAVKSADESVTSSITLQNDDHLSFAVAANERWAFELFLVITPQPNGGFRSAWTVPAGAAGFWTAEIYAGAAGGSAGTTNGFLGSDSLTANLAYAALTNAVCIIRIRGVVNVGANAGTMQFQWAQDTSSATATVLKAGSWLRATRMS